jgi:hypothetical protein
MENGSLIPLCVYQCFPSNSLCTVVLLSCGKSLLIPHPACLLDWVQRNTTALLAATTKNNVALIEPLLFYGAHVDATDHVCLKYYVYEC